MEFDCDIKLVNRILGKAFPLSLHAFAIKEQYGDRICLWGNIDVAGVLTRGTPEEVRADTIEHMERLAVEGGYIVGSSHDLSENVPLENVYALRDAVHEFRFRAPAPERPQHFP